MESSPLFENIAKNMKLFVDVIIYACFSLFSKAACAFKFTKFKVSHLN